MQQFRTETVRFRTRTVRVRTISVRFRTISVRKHFIPGHNTQDRRAAVRRGAVFWQRAAAVWQRGAAIRKRNAAIWQQNVAKTLQRPGDPPGRRRDAVVGASASGLGVGPRGRSSK